MKNKLPILTEMQEQRQFTLWFRATYPKTRISSQAAGLKGTKYLAMQGIYDPGEPDIRIYAARLGYHGLIIELKRTKMYKFSEHQKNYLNDLNTAGYYAVMCVGADEAIEVSKDYMGLSIIVGPEPYTIDWIKYDKEIKKK